MLCDEYTYERFNKIHVVWSVRVKEELDAFNSWLSNIGIDYIPIVTRDDRWLGHDQRITTLIKEGIIMKDSTPKDTKVMLCGNMDFNKEVKSLLEERDYVEGSNRKNGSFVLEKAFVG